MYDICTFLENVKKFFNIKTKLLYWKIKYGKRLKLGKNVTFRKGFIINIGKNGYLEIGDNNFFNNYCSINVHEKVIIGNNNDFGESVKIYDHSKVFNDKKVDMKHTYKSKPIYIGNNNWVCSNVVILNNSKIECDCVIGAGVIYCSKIKDKKIIKRNEEYIIESIKYKY